MTLAELKKEVSRAIEKAYGKDLDLARYSLTYTADAKFGDVTTNAAMIYAKELGMSAREAADKLASKLTASLETVKKVEVAGPGFINITLSDQQLSDLADEVLVRRPATYVGQEVVTEYSDPNPFKVLHVGHLYTSVVGDAITNLIRIAGGKAHPVNFGGDVGLHVGKTLWGIVRELGGEHPDKLTAIKEDKRPEWMARCYAAGSLAYEQGGDPAKRIGALNEQVYAIHESDDHDSPLAKIYWTCRTWSYEYFDAFYERIGIKFEKYYPESETTPIGIKTVREQLQSGVYTSSDGAVVFEGERFGLHTRVFITSRGLPTYEAKDVGLIISKWEDYHFDRSIVITGNDILEYMKVVLKSIEQFEPKLAARTTHITHGNVRLAGGVKMSSRKGNFLAVTTVLDVAADANRIANGKDDEQVVLGAVKYAFLKSRIGLDLVYSPEESVSLEGNSGPYLQYAHARARSILAKGGLRAGKATEYGSGERVLVRKLIEYPEVLQQAVDELMPHIVCTYLYELAQVFNRFYEGNRVLGDSREEARVRLVGSYADVLRDGLTLLGIAAPERL
jgi:arginyl-tRNA synthetase